MIVHQEYYQRLKDFEFKLYATVWSKWLNEEEYEELWPSLGSQTDKEFCGMLDSAFRKIVGSLGDELITLGRRVDSVGMIDTTSFLEEQPYYTRENDSDIVFDSDFKRGVQMEFDYALIVYWDVNGLDELKEILKDSGLILLNEPARGRDL